MKHKIIYIILSVLVLLFYSCSNEKITDDGKLPEILIFTKDRIEFNKKSPCLIIFNHNGQLCSRGSTIKCRGGYSSKFLKHSYRIELSKKYNPFDLPIEDDWILNANYIDKTFNRHKISYDLFRKMGDYNLAPKCRYVSVKLNLEYKGLYLLMQKINGKFCGIDKKDETASIFKDPPVFNETQIIKEDTLNYYEQNFPDFEEKNNNYLLKDFRDFILNTPDSTFNENVGKWIDLQSVVDWHILLLLTNNADGLVKNFYLYKINSDTPFRIAIWDYDHSFGRDGDNELNMLKYKIDIEKNILLKRLINNPESNYLHNLKERWFELRNSGIISEASFGVIILKNHFLIHSELTNNFNKWPVNSDSYFDDNNYEDEIEIMMKYIKIRIPELDEYFNSIP